MSGLDIVGVGLAALDLLVRLKDMPTWERGSSMSSVGIDGGGPVATALVAASRLGARVGYVGIAGNDKLGKIKMDSLVENDVDTSRSVIRSEPESQVVLVCVHEGTGERVFSGLRRWRADMLRADELDRDYITSAQYLHLDSCHPEAALQAAKWMREAGKKVVLDGSKTSGPIPPYLRELIEYVGVLICASGFGPSLTGRTDVWEVGEAILGMGPSIVVQTEGEEGSYTVTAEERFHTPAFKVKVMDTTGAGDVFHGAYIVGLLHGWAPHHIALFSSAVAAMKCTKLGGRAGIPCLQEALAFLRERGIEIE